MIKKHVSTLVGQLNRFTNVGKLAVFWFKTRSIIVLLRIAFCKHFIFLLSLARRSFLRREEERHSERHRCDFKRVETVCARAL